MKVESIFNRYKPKMSGDDVFDPIRYGYFKATPEEIVRQKTIKFLIGRLHVPSYSIVVEKSLSTFGVKGAEAKKRIDIGILDEDRVIMAVVECKAPQIDIKKGAEKQAKDYLLSLNTQYFYVTNGREFDGYYYDTEYFIYLAKLPTYENWYNYPTYKE